MNRTEQYFIEALKCFLLGEKIESDIEYIEKFSLWMDICIYFKTVLVVLKQDGIAFTKNDAITQKHPEPAKAETL